MWNWEKSDWSVTWTKNKKQPFGGAAQTETGKVMQSSSDSILRRPPADKRRPQTTQLLFSCSKSDSCSSSSRFPSRGWSLNAREQNSPFWQWHQRRLLAFVLEVCLKWAEGSEVVGQVFRCCALGMIISCYQCRSLETAVSVTWIIISPFSPADV